MQAEHPQQVHEPGAVPPFNGTAKTGVGQPWTLPVRDSRKAKNKKPEGKFEGLRGRGSSEADHKQAVRFDGIKRRG